MYRKLVEGIFGGMLMNKNCYEILKELEGEGCNIWWDYEFPEPQPLTTRLKDVLDEEVDEKFYLSEEQTERLIQNSDYLQDLTNEPKINILAHRKSYRRNTQVFDPNGITETLDTGQGGGRGHYTIGVKMNRNEVKGEQDIARTLLARDYKGFGNQYMNGVVVEPLGTLDSNNYEDNPSHTVTSAHMPKVYGGVTDFRIRKLTPKETWRLMGMSDDDFHKAEAVNSNTQLYKQAGNSIVVSVLEGIFRNMFEKESVDE